MASSTVDDDDDDDDADGDNDQNDRKRSSVEVQRVPTALNVAENGRLIDTATSEEYPRLSCLASSCFELSMTRLLETGAFAVLAVH